MIIPSKNYSDAELFLTRIIIPRHSHPVNLARALATQTSRFFVNHEIHEIHENVFRLRMGSGGRMRVYAEPVDNVDMSGARRKASRQRPFAKVAPSRLRRDSPAPKASGWPRPKAEPRSGRKSPSASTSSLFTTFFSCI